MEYRKLGNTGTAVSRIALGTMYFGVQTPEDEAFALLDAFVDADGNLVDTSNVYGGGRSEEIIGRWFASRPSDVTDRVVLATKGRYGTGTDVNSLGSTRRQLRRSLDASLRRLGRDHVDLYQIHAWDPLTPIEETLSFLDDAVHAGKINYVGLSNFTGWQLQLTLSTAQQMGTHAPVSLQQQYSLLSRESEYEVIPAALHNQVSLLPWSPSPAASSPASTSAAPPPIPTPAPVLTTSCTSGSAPSTPPPTATGTPSTRSSASPARSAPRPARSPWPGQPTSLPLPPPSSAPAPSPTSPKTSARPNCTSTPTPPRPRHRQRTPARRLPLRRLRHSTTLPRLHRQQGPSQSHRRRKRRTTRSRITGPGQRPALTVRRAPTLGPESAAGPVRPG